MGVPKRKRSKARNRRRRAEVMRIEAPNLVRCPQCQELVRPHHMCSECGYYKDRVVRANEA
ncbi:50S ribosomal protein L32 [Desulfofalx alkaliphila]|uniref:50S ribosomal protein L32 n=1 Tax=Desulfofalx alkaliphila TaxID=105483 RepID=UPI000A03B1AA|nr:50S ribosomal protein L32 [Desulfofalx alkaliphila]